VKKVTVLTATTGREDLIRCIKSVAKQTHQNIEHIVIVDGPEAQSRVLKIYHNLRLSNDQYKLQFVFLPKSIGKDRWNGHRIYPSGTFMADGDYVCFLDDDNYFQPDHVESLVHVIEKQFRDWSYSFRTLFDANNNRLGNDDCESLGQWPSVCGPTDYFIDVNCFMLPIKMAVEIAPTWYRKFREPGQPEVDRVLTHRLRQYYPNFDSNYKYSVNYKVAGGALSVQPEFFEQGNNAMLQRYNGKLPWRK
jgi:glycosyltransferase involved in cell wall biosynthesis